MTAIAVSTYLVRLRAAGREIGLYFEFHDSEPKPVQQHLNVD